MTGAFFTMWAGALVIIMALMSALNAGAITSFAAGAGVSLLFIGLAVHQKAQARR